MHKQLLATLVLAFALPALAQEADLGFIRSLPGVTALTQSGGVSTYQVARAADTFNAVLQGLRSRGWRIGNVTDQETSRASIRTLSATREGQRVTVSITNADIGGTMTVRAGGGSDVGVVQGDFGVGRTVVNENGQTRAMVLSNTQLMVAGNHNHLTLTGQTPVVMVNGNDNDITLDARAGRVEINGNHNVVRWTKRANPTAPAVIDNGSGNQVLQGK